MSMLVLLAAAAQVAPAKSIDGRWINPARTVIIQIAPCGGERCGVVEWASPQAEADARKGTPKLVGTALLTKLEPRSATQWAGRLFVPDRNIRASAKVRLLEPDELKVSGCALGGILCDSQVWTRAPATNP